MLRIRVWHATRAFARVVSSPSSSAHPSPPSSASVSRLSFTQRRQSASFSSEPAPVTSQLPPPLRELLGNRHFLVFDGGMGTALKAQGCDTDGVLWSATGMETEQGLALVGNVHRAFLTAGADIIGTNSYKVSAELLRRISDDQDIDLAFEDPEEYANFLIRRSVEIAKNEVDAFCLLRDSPPSPDPDGDGSGGVGGGDGVECSATGPDVTSAATENDGAVGGREPTGRGRPLVAGSIGPFGTVFPFRGRLQGQLRRLHGGAGGASQETSAGFACGWCGPVGVRDNPRYRRSSGDHHTARWMGPKREHHTCAYLDLFHRKESRDDTEWWKPSRVHQAGS